MRAANKAGHKPDAPLRGKNAAKRARALAEKSADAMPVVKASGPKLERHVRAELVDPSPQGGLLEVFQQRYVLKLLVQRQLAAMYAASLLGLLWSYVQPALRFGVYYLVMGVVVGLHKGVPFFAIHLFTGIVVTHFFSEVWNGGTRSIWQNKGLIQKMRMPRELFPVSAAMVGAYHTIPQLLVLVLCSVIVGWHLNLTAIAAGVLGLAILMVFSLALGLFFSALNVFYRDFQNIVQTVLTFMHFLVPMMYSFGRVWGMASSHPVLYQIYMANPVAQAVLLLQRFFWFPLVKHPHREIAGRAFPPDLFERGLITLLVCLLLLFVAQKFFSRAESKFPQAM